MLRKQVRLLHVNVPLTIRAYLKGEVKGLEHPLPKVFNGKIGEKLQKSRKKLWKTGK